jgi:hypothetical protein
MKLRSQILGFGLSGTLLAGLAGGIGLFTSSRLGDSLSDAVEGSHALLGALEKNSDRVAEAQAGLKEHAERFNAAWGGLEGSHLSASSNDALAAVRPLVSQYIEAVSMVVSLSATNAAAAQVAMQPLQAVFTELETQIAGGNQDLSNRTEQQASAQQ